MSIIVPLDLVRKALLYKFALRQVTKTKTDKLIDVINIYIKISRTHTHIYTHTHTHTHTITNIL